LAQVADRLGQNLGPGRWNGLQVRADVPWIQFVLCTSCGRQNFIRRFAHLGSHVGLCTCGELLTAGPLGKYTVVPHQDLAQTWNTPLAKLGLDHTGSLALGLGTDWTYFFLPAQNFGTVDPE
jgi:hypothetical protein